MQPRQTTLFATPACSLTATSYLPTVLLAPSLLFPPFPFALAPFTAPFFLMLPIARTRVRISSLGRDAGGVPDNDADALNAAITTGMIMNFIVLQGRLFADFHY